MLPRITGEFTVGTDPTLKFAQSGIAIAGFSAVASKSKKNDAGEWENEKEIWVRVTAFKDVAEHVAESITKGMRVVISGQVSVSEWETKEGEKRTSVEVIADDIGVSLRYGTVAYSKAERSTTASSGATDPWSTNPNQQGENTPPPF